MGCRPSRRLGLPSPSREAFPDTECRPHGYGIDLDEMVLCDPTEKHAVRPTPSSLCVLKIPRAKERLARTSDRKDRANCLIYSLAAVNFCLFLVGTIQCSRILAYQSSQKGSTTEALKSMEKDIVGSAKNAEKKIEAKL